MIDVALILARTEVAIAEPDPAPSHDPATLADQLRTTLAHLRAARQDVIALCNAARSPIYRAPRRVSHGFISVPPTEIAAGATVQIGRAVVRGVRVMGLALRPLTDADGGLGTPHPSIRIMALQIGLTQVPVEPGGVPLGAFDGDLNAALQLGESVMVTVHNGTDESVVVGGSLFVESDDS